MKHILMVLCALTMGACGSKFDAAKISEKLTKEFNIPVEVNIVKTDYCGVKQLTDFYNEYSYLPKASKQVVKDKIAQYDKLIFGATVKSGELKGKLFRLIYRRCENGGCWTDASKDIKDETFVNGALPVATVRRGVEMVITNQSMDDLVELTVYSTTSLNAYSIINEMNDQFDTALNLQAIRLYNTNSAPGLKCATSLTLVDLF